MVIYSMATSTLGDPLHGMKFVCSLNRLKVVMFRGALGLRSGGMPRAFHARMPDAATDTASERLLPLSRTGDGDSTAALHHGCPQNHPQRGGFQV